MNLIKTAIWVFIITLLFFNCTKKPIDNLKTYFEEKQFDINFNDNLIIVLIPVDGCHTCVNKAVEFMIDHPNYPFHYVLSSVLNKNLEYISGMLTVKPDRFYLDYDNTLMMKEIVDRTPKAYFVNKNRIIFSIELSTEKSYQECAKMINKNFGFSLGS